ncbi:hypothetical protein EDF68_103300 [Ochrobactrum sp. BH3]|nr:hypothetical protein EDF68_103300 [Ochrobactrum sp. BH3]
MSTYERIRDYVPMSTGQYCLMIDESNGGVFPDALFTSGVERPRAGLMKVTKVNPKTFTASAYIRQLESFEVEEIRCRREHVIAVTDALANMLALIDKINGMAKAATALEQQESDRIRAAARLEILSLLPQSFIVERNAA